MSNLRSRLHRHGIARVLSDRYVLGKCRESYVETALPWQWLAVWAAVRPSECYAGMPRVAEVSSAGTLRRRWVIHYR